MNNHFMNNHFMNNHLITSKYSINHPSHYTDIHGIISIQFFYNVSWYNMWYPYVIYHSLIHFFFSQPLPSSSLIFSPSVVKSCHILSFSVLISSFFFMNLTVWKVLNCWTCMSVRVSPRSAKYSQEQEPVHLVLFSSMNWMLSAPG